MASSVPPVSISGTSSRGQAKIERAIAAPARKRFDLDDLPEAPVHTCAVVWDERDIRFQVSYLEQDVSPNELKALLAEEEQRRKDQPDLSPQMHAVLDLAGQIHRMLVGWADEEGEPILRRGVPVEPTLGELETSKYSFLGSILRDINEDMAKRRAQQIDAVKARQKADRIATGTA